MHKSKDPEQNHAHLNMATGTTTGAGEGAGSGAGELSGDEDLLVEEDVKQKPPKIPKTSIWGTTDEESEQSQVISLTWCLSVVVPRVHTFSFSSPSFSC